MDPQIQECLSCLICCFTIMFIIGMTGVFKGCNETSTNMCTNEVFTGTVYAINLDCCTDDGNCDCDGEVITAYIHAEHIDEFNVSTSTCRYWYYTESMKLSYEIGDEVTWLRKAHTTSCITFPTAEERFIGGIVLIVLSCLCCLWVCLCCCVSMIDEKVRQEKEEERKKNRHNYTNV